MWNENIETILEVLSLIGFIAVLVSYIYLLFKKWNIWSNQYGDDPSEKPPKQN